MSAIHLTTGNINNFRLVDTVPFQKRRFDGVAAWFSLTAGAGTGSLLRRRNMWELADRYAGRR